MTAVYYTPCIRLEQNIYDIFIGPVLTKKYTCTKRLFAKLFVRLRMSGPETAKETQLAAVSS